MQVGHRRLVALGDSFTEGLEDGLGTHGRHRGWADRVAEALAAEHGGIEYANLAVRGRLLGQVVAEQLPVALSLDPDLVTFHAGPNDVLRPRVDLAGLLHRYAKAVARLRATGATVVLFTVIGRSGARGRLADAVATRFAVFNDHVRHTAATQGATLVDVGGAAAMGDPRLWHEDRLHLNAHGHARVAAAVLEALGTATPDLLGGEPGWWRQALPAERPAGRVAALGTEARWVRRHLVPWVGRRVRGVSSGDRIAPKHPEPVVLPHPGPADPSVG